LPRAQAVKAVNATERAMTELELALVLTTGNVRKRLQERT
jgi:hypothetical protein